jgi:hypothetical protein
MTLFNLCFVRPPAVLPFLFFFLFSLLFFFSSRRYFLPVFLETTVRSVRVHFKGNPVVQVHLDTARQGNGNAPGITGQVEIDSACRVKIDIRVRVIPIPVFITHWSRGIRRGGGLMVVAILGIPHSHGYFTPGGHTAGTTDGSHHHQKQENQ